MNVSSNAPSDLDPKVLGQIMAAENILHVLPTDEKIGEFTVRVMEKLPGVATSRICIRGAVSPPATLSKDPCGRCQIDFEKGCNHSERTCVLSAAEGFQTISIETADSFLGLLFVQTGDSKLFALYRPFVRNFCNQIAIHLENRRQREELQKRHDNLESMVYEKTQDLDESEEKFAKAFQNAPLLMTLTSIEDGRFLDVNKAFERISGYRREQAIGFTSTEIGFVKKRDRERMLRILEAKERVLDLEIEARRADGSTMVCLYSCEAIEIKGKKRLLSIALDISARKAAEQRLKESQMFLDNMSDAAYIADDKGCLVWTNVAGERITGVDRKDLVEKPFLELFLEQDRASLIDAYNRTLAGESLENTWTFQSGRTCHFTSLPKYNETGKIVGTFGVARDITERLAVETALKVSEARLKKAQEIGRIGAWELDVKKNALFWADENYKMFGLPKDMPLTYETFLNCVHPDDREAVDSTWKASLKGAPYEIEHRILVDGEVKWVREKAELAFDENSDCIRAIGFNQDITVRKQAENSLRDERRRLKDIIKGTNAGTWEWNVQTGETIFNERWAEIIGYRLDEISPVSINTWMRFCHPDDFAVCNGQLERHFCGEVDYYECEARMKHADGSWVWVLDRGRVTSWTRDGKPEWMYGIHLDITWRKRVEHMLRESEEKYRSMMESMKDPVYICSQDYRIEYMNPAMVQRTGREAIGEHCFKVVHDLDEKCPWCLLHKIETDDLFETDIISPKDNCYFHVSNSRIFHEDGSVSKMTTLRDLSDLKKIESQLHQAQRMEAIGSLAGGIAHDFNNILFPILGMSEMLLEDLPAASLNHQNAEEIYKAGKRGSGLVKQILAFSRQSENKPIPVGFQKIMGEVLRLCRRTIPSYITIEQDIQDDCGMMMADPTQLHQIGMNLITNAYHAVEATHGRISVTLNQTVQKPSDAVQGGREAIAHAELTVTDNGSGIDPTVLDKIFDPYFTTKEQGKGTGLGLAVVYGIVKDLGGDIKIESDVGKGTTVRVVLPLMEPDGTEKLNLVEEAEPMGNERILLVDDEKAVLNLEEKMLGRLGYRVTSKLDSTDALKEFTANPTDFDLVLTDLTMPVMTGDQLAEALIQIRPNIPVIICTGFSERFSKEKAAAIGVKGFLMKPVVKSKLARIVRQAIDGVEAYWPG